MLEKNGAEVLCDCLRREGVEVVFGIPGVHNLQFFEALRRSGIRLVLPTHEQAAGFMANGYSRATGKTGVFITVPGPGFTNAFTSIAESLLDSCAVVGIVTGVRNDSDKKFQLHEIQQVDLAKPIVKGVDRVTSAGQILAKIEAAFRLARSGEPGPVILEIPANAFWEPAEYHKPGVAEDIGALPDGTANLPQVIALMKQAKRVGLFLGQGALDASEQVAQIAEWLSAPVVTTVSGRGCLREDHPLALGFRWASHGVAKTNRVLAQCDLILAVGAKFSETGTTGYSLEFTGPLIQVDSSDGVLGKNYPAAVTLQMDARELFDQLLKNKEFIGRREDREILKIIEEQKADPGAPTDDVAGGIRFGVGERDYSPRKFFGVLRQVLPDDAIVVTDSGYNQFLTIENLTVLAPRTLIVPSDYQSMGYCIPSAIGAAAACPRKKVVAVVGDGGFAMSGFELLTAYRENLDLLLVVLNDGYFGFMKEMQEELFGATTGVVLANPDFEKLAESLHAHYHVVTGDLKDTLTECTQRQGPTLLEVKVIYPKKELVPLLRRRWKANLKQLAKEGRQRVDQARLLVR